MQDINVLKACFFFLQNTFIILKSFAMVGTNEEHVAMINDNAEGNYEYIILSPIINT